MTTYFKARFDGTCRVCGYRFMRGVTIAQDDHGTFHKACDPGSKPSRTAGAAGSVDSPPETFLQRAARYDREARGERARRDTRRKTRPEV